MITLWVVDTAAEVMVVDMAWEDTPDTERADIPDMVHIPDMVSTPVMVDTPDYLAMAKNILQATVNPVVMKQNLSHYIIQKLGDINPELEVQVEVQ